MHIGLGADRLVRKSSTIAPHAAAVSTTKTAMTPA